MFTKANAIKPSAQYYLELGVVLHGSGRLDEAIGAFRSALQLDPTLVEAQFNLGIALEAKGLASQARQQYEDALKITKDERTMAQLRLRLSKIAATTGSPNAVSAPTSSPAGAAE
jgi:tetratricopeptide (TPR) repeat protein